MGRNRKKWPHYALWALEDVMARLGTLDGHVGDMQNAAIEGNAMLVVTTGGDARNEILEMRKTLIGAKNGEYADE